MLENLKKQFPYVTFTRVTERFNPRNEGETFYPFGAPKGETEKGDFVRMTNVKGGADTVSITNKEGMLKLAAFHQQVGVRSMS